MTIAQILELLAQVQAQLVALQSSTTQFSQADLDAAVAQAKADQASLDAVAQAALQATIDSLGVQVVSLQSQVDGIGAIVAGAVASENARVITIVKDLLEGEEKAILEALARPA